MLGIILIFFVARLFYSLADKYGRNKWVFAILSIVNFFGIQVVIGLLIGLFGDTSILDDELLLTVIGLLSSIAATTILYFSLQAFWQKHPKNKVETTDLLDQ